MSPLKIRSSREDIIGSGVRFERTTFVCYLTTKAKLVISWQLTTVLKPQSRSITPPYIITTHNISETLLLIKPLVMKLYELCNSIVITPQDKCNTAPHNTSETPLVVTPYNMCNLLIITPNNT